MFYRLPVNKPNKKAKGIGNVDLPDFNLLFHC